MKTRLVEPAVLVSCPFCGNQIDIPRPQGNTIDMPLVCTVCGRSFTPRFYCPDRKASQRHVFESRALYVDNLHGLYTFCPEHTFTTYDIVTPDGHDEQSPGGIGMLQAWAVVVQSSLSALLFRVALIFESVRQRLSPHTG